MPKDLLSRDPTTAFWLGLLAALALTSLAFGFPAPIGIYALGLVIGSLIAFLSIGLVLIYRTNRIINFAQGDIGAVAVVVTVLLVSESGMNYFLGALIGIALAVGLGALIEVSVIRRFFKAPRLILTIATIGLTQLLVFIEILLPRIWQTDFVTAFSTPFSWSFRISSPTDATSVIFNANHLLSVMTVPLVVGGLTLFLRYTRAGVASRAVADNAERASLLGIPVKRVSTIVWMVAAGLSAVGALMRAPTVGLSILGGAFGPALLIRALAPAVVGKMENMRTTFVAALVLGVVDQAAFFRTGDESISNALLFAVILAALLFQRRGAMSRAGELEGATWQAIKEIRPVPRELRGVKELSMGRRLGAAALLLLVMWLGFFGNSLLVSLILIYAIIGLSLVILTGWAGQISLGQFAFVALGAAVCANLAIDKGYHFLIALVLAGLVGALVAVVIGLPALRVRGLFLAASTIAFGLFVSSVVLNRNYFGWLVPYGRFDRPVVFGLDLSSNRPFFLMVLGVTLLSLASVRSLRRSRLGRVLIGGRDNERAVRAFGVNLTTARLTAFALSGFFAALAGGLYGMHQNTVIAESFTVDKSLQVFVMVIIGGLGSIPGAFFGAMFYFVTTYFLPPPWSLLASGFGMLVLLMILPGGIGQLVYGWRDTILRWVAQRRGIIVPSLVADVRVDESILLPGAPTGERPPVAEPAPISGGAE